MYLLRRNWYLLISVLCFLVACRHTPHEVTRGFYYWKTIYRPGNAEIQALKQLHNKRIYIRLFDVDWDATKQTAMPIAPVRFSQPVDTAFTYIPVVFITQGTLTQIDSNGIRELAENIAAYTQQLCDDAHISTPEVQMDCDWTGSVKNKYFALLRLLKEQPYIKGKMLSCTIRMHQAKYVAQSGIPPVDKGMLMCYNMGDLKKYNTRNSILDVDEAKLFLKHLDTYPLPLDVALPLFSWCLVFRDQHFRGILRDVQPEEVSNCPLFRQKDNGKYQCITDSLWKGYLFKTGDIIRTENATFEDIERVARYTTAQIKNRDINVVFFDCDSINLSKYQTYELEKVYADHK